MSLALVSFYAYINITSVDDLMNNLVFDISFYYMHVFEINRNERLQFWSVLHFGLLDTFKYTGTPLSG